MSIEKKKTSSGAKARQRKDKEDRSLPYKDWRREIDKLKDGRYRRTPYSGDIDMYDYIFVDGEPKYWPYLNLPELILHLWGMEEIDIGQLLLTGLLEGMLKLK